MMWPDTIHAVQLKTGMEQFNKRASDFFSWLISYPGLAEGCADEAINGGYLDEDGRLNAFISDVAKGKFAEDDEELFLTLVCAYILQASPDIDTWKAIRKIDSWAVENWLGEAMLAFCKTNKSLSARYAKLIKEIFQAVEANTLKPQSELRRGERENFLAYWTQNTNRLEEIWWQLRHVDTFSLQESKLFSVLAEIDLDGFVNLLFHSQDPVLIQSALEVSGAGHFLPRLEFWEYLMNHAPLSFDQNGVWNNNILLPLLLSHIYNRLSELPGRLLHEYQFSDNTYKDEMAQLTNHIGRVIGQRKDAAGIVTRWGAWLMRNFMLGETETDNLKRPAFLYGMMLDSLGKNTRGVKLPDTSPPESAAWEHMCYFAARSNFAYENSHEIPPLIEFEQVWQATNSEDAYPAISRAKARLSMLFRREDHPLPGLTSYALAFPFISQGQTSDNWLSMWQSSYFMREIAEFGSPDSITDDFSDRHDVGRLLLLLCCIGIAAFDHLAPNGSKGDQFALADATRLHAHLVSAVMEMLALDDTINIPIWKKVFLHLCLRRLIWDQSVIAMPDRNLFNLDSQPDLMAILNYYKPEPIDLCQLISDSLSNGIPGTALKSALSAASIDLSELIEKIRLLNSFSERKYPLNNKHLRDLESLLSAGQNQ